MTLSPDTPRVRRDEVRRTESKPVVLIFKETILPISETFIQSQANNLNTFSPQYIGLGRADPSLPTPQDLILLSSGDSWLSVARQKLYRRIAVAPRFHRLAANANASLIHAHFASGGRSALPLARRLRIPLIVSLWGSDVTVRIPFRDRYRHLWMEASVFLCVSEFIKRKAVEAGFPTAKLLVHYTGIDRGAISPNGEGRQRNLVLFVGRLVEKKGCAFLLRAMAQVKLYHPTARTVVIGDGPLRESLEKLAMELNIPCQFLGSQPALVVRNWMAAARVFCAPSLTAADGDSEGMPTVILEAQATGIPVVSTFHAGIPEAVIDGQSGLLAPEGDPRTLARHILTLLEDDSLWAQYADKAMSRVVAKFDLKSQTRLLEEIYARACDGARPITA